MKTESNAWQISVTGLGVCLALTAAVYAVGIHPQFARQVEAESAQRTLVQKENEAVALVNKLTRLKRDLAAVEGELEASPLRLLPTSAINQRISEMAKLAEANGLKINQVQPSQPEAGKYYSTVPIRLAGSGRFTDVVTFLHRLHVEFKDVGVSSWSVKGEPATPGAKAEFSFGLSWFASPASGENLK